MERLTFDGYFCDIAKCERTPGGSFCEDGACSQRRVWERLKAYEDTGLEPDEIELYKEAQEISESMAPKRLIELAQAEQAGRLLVLPPEGYTWHIRGDIATGLIIANCRRAEAEAEEALGKEAKHG